MKVSVVVCTYARCASLAKALGSIAASTMPDSIEWEVLVVDNNSQDATHNVIEEFCHIYPNRFRHLFEANRGKSYALNTGIREAHGEVIAFVDDDVIVDAMWLQKLTAPLLCGECVGVGGRVLPQCEFDIPDWIRLNERYALGPLVMFDLGTEKRELTEAPFGANMAFRKSAFPQYGGFRTDLGPPPGNEIRGEDSEFFQRLANAGERLCYEPAAVVYHSIPENRLKKEYFLSWWFDKGRTDVRTGGIPAEARRRVGGIPMVWIRRCLVWGLRWMIGVKHAQRFSARLKLWYLAGQITESYHLRCQGNGG